MLKKLEKLLHNELFQCFIVPIISVFFLVICNLEPLRLLKYLGNVGIDIYSYLEHNDYLFNLNITFWLITINAIVSFFFRDLPILKIVIRDSYMQKDNTFLLSPSGISHLSKTYQCEIYVDYGNWVWFKIINLFKGIRVEISLPSWVDVEFNRVWEIGSSSIENGKIIVPVGNMLTSSKLNNYKGELFIGFSLLSRKSCHDKDKIEVILKTFGNRKLSNWIINRCIIIDYVEHTIQTSE